MDDKMIIHMFFQRDQQAIAKAEQKYGDFCRSIALRLLGDVRDAEECVSDTLLAAWESIPPQNPEVLAAYLGKIVRNKAISVLRSRTAAKRNSGADILLSELKECLPSDSSVEEDAEAGALSTFISSWLLALRESERTIFILRYWYGYNPKEIAERAHTSPAHISRKLFRLRQSLKKALESQGVNI